MTTAHTPPIIRFTIGGVCAFPMVQPFPERETANAFWTNTEDAAHARIMAALPLADNLPGLEMHWRKLRRWLNTTEDPQGLTTAPASA